MHLEFYEESEWKDDLKAYRYAVKDIDVSSEKKKAENMVKYCEGLFWVNGFKYSHINAACDAGCQVLQQTQVSSMDELWKVIKSTEAFNDESETYILWCSFENARYKEVTVRVFVAFNFLELLIASPSKELADELARALDKEISE